MVLVCTSTVGVAVGWAAVVMGADDDGRAIAAAATPPSAESTATAAMTGVRRLMPTPSAATPHASGSPEESFGTTSGGRVSVWTTPDGARRLYDRRGDRGLGGADRPDA